MSRLTSCATRSGARMAESLATRPTDDLVGGLEVDHRRRGVLAHGVRQDDGPSRVVYPRDAGVGRPQIDAESSHVSSPPVRGTGRCGLGPGGGPGRRSGRRTRRRRLPRWCCAGQDPESVRRRAACGGCSGRPRRRVAVKVSMPHRSRISATSAANEPIRPSSSPARCASRDSPSCRRMRSATMGSSTARCSALLQHPVFLVQPVDDLLAMRCAPVELAQLVLDGSELLAEVGEGHRRPRLTSRVSAASADSGASGDGGALSFMAYLSASACSPAGACRKALSDMSAMAGMAAGRRRTGRRSE